MDDNRPLVSIIVRTKDRPKLLSRALRSIAVQTHRPLEVVLVNDGGCDLHIEELTTILGDVSLAYERLKQNRGRAHAANTGIRAAHGDYVGFLDDDDELHPDHIESLVTFLKQSDYKVAYADTEMVFVDFSTDEGRFVDTHQVMFSKDFSYYDLLISNYIPFNSILFPREVLAETGSLDESFELYEDWDFLIRAAGRYPFYHIRKTTARYNQWSRSLQINRADMDHMRSVNLRILEKHREKIAPAVLQLKGQNEDLQRAVQDLQRAVQDAMARSARLEGISSERDERIKSLEQLISETHVHYQGVVRDSEARIACLETAVSEKEARIGHLQEVVTAMQETLGWKVLERMRGIREKTLPRDTRRRRLYDLAIRAVKVARHEGVRGVLARSSRKVKNVIERFRSLARKGYAVYRSYGTKTFLRHTYRYLRYGRGSFGAATTVLIAESAWSRSYMDGLMSYTFGQTIEARLPIDIIMPVYNGYDYLVSCYESIVRHTDLGMHTLIVVDDGSPDSRVREFLASIGGDGRNVDVRYNDQNLGFVKTANQEMRRSQNDVILLNTDTIVTSDWVNKLQRAAYSRPDIATVTPFSNNATHCSIPRFLEDNSVPEGCTIDSFAGFIEAISLCYYPDIPLAVGFCMYIRRRALVDVGYFNEELFARGYGEECEFCARASRRGYRHILDDTTYIYHKGSVSFTPEGRAAVVDAHLAAINERYPEFMPAVSSFYRTNPLRTLHEYISLRIGT